MLDLISLFDLPTIAYVNGQRQGRVMEKAFCKGDSIASERFTNDPSSTSLPPLDVENEINLASNSESKSEADEVTQMMKDLGLERSISMKNTTHNHILSSFSIMIK